MKKYVMVDDLDGVSEATETIPFALDGDHYEIDLTRENAEELRMTLARYAKVARPTRVRNGTPKNGKPASSSSKPKRRKRGANGSASPTPGDVRAWAKAQGIDVNPTGRVPKALVEQYIAGRS